MSIGLEGVAMFLRQHTLHKGIEDGNARQKTEMDGWNEVVTPISSEEDDSLTVSRPHIVQEWRGSQNFQWYLSCQLDILINH
jgi:hypothetical protein